MKTRIRVAVPVLAAAVALVAVHAVAGPPETKHGSSRVQRGQAIAPVPLDLTDKNPAKVYLGSYLVNAVGGCNDCHTNPSYVDDPFNGDPGVVNAEHYLAGGRAFGPFISANITPDENGKPAGLTRAEFIELLRTGHEEEGGTLQVMPWPVYRNMTTADLGAIYAYLTAIPHAEPAE